MEVNLHEHPDVLALLHQMSECPIQQLPSLIDVFHGIVLPTFTTQNLLKEHDPHFVEPDVLEKYVEGDFLLGKSVKDTNVCWGSIADYKGPVGIFGEMGLGKTTLSYSIVEQGLEKSRKDELLKFWIYSRSREWLKLQEGNEDNNVNAFTYILKNGNLTTNYRYNHFESPIPGSEEAYLPTAVEICADVSEQTIAARTILSKVCLWLLRERNTIPTFRKILGSLEWVKMMGDKKRERDFLGYKDDVRNTTIGRMGYFLDEGKDMFTVDKGIPFKKLVESHNIWDLSLIGQDLYEFLVMSHLMKLFWYKSNNLASWKYTHIIVLDDAIKALME